MGDEVSANNPSAIILEDVFNEALAILEQDREKEIITRRFGLKERKETLEQIGELLGITRERVRQLEKAILIRLKIAAEDKKINSLENIDRLIIRHLSEKGRVGKIKDIANDLFKKNHDLVCSRLAFVAELSPNLIIINENDNFYLSIGIKKYGEEKYIKEEIGKIVKAIKEYGRPAKIEAINEILTNFEHPNHIAALASISKHLANLNGNWGLINWPTVNPKNIRDKIYVILMEYGKPMHFSEISSAIQESRFKRKNVTTQAIHNELIKDDRFVLIGRGIYALNDWGFSKGTVSEIITKILKNAEEPLHRDEIVRRVLKNRQVKETTILLNLQSRSEFKRVAKATYTLNV